MSPDQRHQPRLAEAAGAVLASVAAWGRLLFLLAVIAVTAGFIMFAAGIVHGFVPGIGAPVHTGRNLMWSGGEGISLFGLVNFLTGVFRLPKRRG